MSGSRVRRIQLVMPLKRLIILSVISTLVTSDVASSRGIMMGNVGSGARVCPELCSCSANSNGPFAVSCAELSTKNFAQLRALNVKSTNNENCNEYVGGESPSVLSDISSVTNCSLNYVPAGSNFYRQFSSLAEVDLSGNQLRKVNSNLFLYNQKLRFVRMRDNRILVSKYRPFLISKSIWELDLSYCNLVDIPWLMFSGLPNLRYLTLNNNKLKWLHYNTLPLGIKTLNLAHNEIGNVPTEELLRVKKLKEIDLSENPINCSCELIGFQNWLSGQGVFLNNIVCSYPEMYKGEPLIDLSEYEMCDVKAKSDSKESFSNVILPVMDGFQGDQPALNTNHDHGPLYEGPDVYQNDEVIPVAKKANKRESIDEEEAKTMEASGDGQLDLASYDEKASNKNDADYEDEVNNTEETDLLSKVTSLPTTKETSVENSAEKVANEPNYNDSFEASGKTSKELPNTATSETVGVPEPSSTSNVTENSKPDEVAPTSESSGKTSEELQNTGKPENVVVPGSSSTSNVTENSKPDEVAPTFESSGTTSEELSNTGTSETIAVSEPSSTSNATENSKPDEVAPTSESSGKTSEELPNTGTPETVAVPEPSSTSNVPENSKPDEVAPTSESSGKTSEELPNTGTPETVAVPEPSSTSNVTENLKPDEVAPTSESSEKTSEELPNTETPETVVVPELSSTSNVTENSKPDEVARSSESSGDVTEVSDTTLITEREPYKVPLPFDNKTDEKVREPELEYTELPSTVIPENVTSHRNLSGDILAMGSAAGQDESSRREVNIFGLGLKYVIIACVIVGLVIFICLGVFISGRSKAFRKSWSPEENRPPGENEGTELQDVSLLSVSGKSSIVKRSNKYPEEKESEQTVGLMSEQSDEPDSGKRVWEAPFGNGTSASNGRVTKSTENLKDCQDKPAFTNSKLSPKNDHKQAATDVQLAKVKVTTLPDSIPRTPIIIDRSSMIEVPLK